MIEANPVAKTISTISTISFYTYSVPSVTYKDFTYIFDKTTSGVVKN